MKEQKTNSAIDRALEKFANVIIKQLETFEGDWNKPWFTEGGVCGIPCNLEGRKYNGINSLVLSLLSATEGFAHPYFGTFNAFKALNEQGKRTKGEKGTNVSVQKGSVGFPIIFPAKNYFHKPTSTRLTPKEYACMPEAFKDECYCHVSMMVSTVFNVAQTNLKDARPDLWAKIVKVDKKPKWEHGEMFDFEPIDKMMAENLWICPIKQIYQDRSYFSQTKNEIVMPEKEQFKDGESFYSTLFHEMAHSTGHESQLARLKPSAFGSKDYAREELVAELSAAIMSQENGMNKKVCEESMAYLKGWLKNLREEPEFLKTVLTDVKKATAMIRQKINEVEQGAEQPTDESKEE